MQKEPVLQFQKDIILTSFLQGLKNIMAILCQKFHFSFFIAIVS